MNSMVRFLRWFGLVALLAACAGEAPREECPVDLSHVEPFLVTPPEGVELILGGSETTGAERLRRTLTRPVDEMIANDGGIEAAIRGGRRHVERYKAELANGEKVREEFRGYGRSEEWIDYYLMSVEDGVTINQAFVDAVECRKRAAGA